MARSWQPAPGRGQLALAGFLAGQAASGLVEEWLSDSWHTRGHGLVALACSKLATTAAGPRASQTYSLRGGCLQLTPPGTGSDATGRPADNGRRNGACGLVCTGQGLVRVV